jgi:RNA-binding protein YlmH
MADFFSTALTKVATDTVSCAPCEIGAGFTDGKKYAPINDTVASERLDCVVAALTNQSREAAQRAVRSGLVEVNFELVERTDLLLEAPAWISVRGFGRYRLRAFDGETKKGRLRLRADRLI